MKPRHQVSRAAIAMIKRFEGYRRQAAQLPDGRWTIGYGHTRSARKGAVVSEQDAEALLIYDLMAVARALNEWTFTPLNQNQFDALCSFAFNIGLEPFRQSLVLRRLNEGAHLQAALAMELWRRAEVDGERIVVDALIRRRSAETSLFLTPPGTWVPAPTAVLRPDLDIDLAGLVPRQAPEPVEASMEGDTIELKRDAQAFIPSESAPETPEPSPARAAAEAVTSRLAGLFRELDPAEAANAPPPATADRPAAETAPAQLSSSEPKPFAPAEAAFRPTRTEDANAVIERLEAQAAAHTPQARDLAPLAVLAGLGLALFVGGLYWAFRVAPDAGVSTGGALSVGWLAGVAGIGFFSVAAYRLFERLGQADGDETLNR